MKKEKPKLWERSKEAFWDDEHISAQMLRSHLDPNFDGASRNYEFVCKSLEWLYRIIPSNSKILDLGCGPGLYTKPLSEKGYQVTGFDLSRRSIAYAKDHDAKTTYILGNYLDLDFENAFDVITIIYCDFGALTKPEREIVLKKIYRALKPNGKFIFDVFTEVYFDKQNTELSIEEYKEGGFWSKEPYKDITQNFKFPRSKAIVMKTHIITSNSNKEYLIWDTCYSIERIRKELEHCDFEIESYYGDVSGIEYQDNSETMCIIARKKD